MGLLLALLASRRVVGVSGVLGGLLPAARGDAAWRVAFLGGLLAGGSALSLLAPAAVRFDISRSLAAMAVGGLLVGFGTRLSNGCTSGHGVCGVGRLSPRSLAASAAFMAAGALVVLAVARLLGGRI